MAEQVPDDRGIPERLVDDRPLALAQVPGYLLAEVPTPKPVRYGIPPAERFWGEPRSAVGVVDIMALGEHVEGGGAYEGTQRPSLGMY